MRDDGVVAFNENIPHEPEDDKYLPNIQQIISELALFGFCMIHTIVSGLHNCGTSLFSTKTHFDQ